MKYTNPAGHDSLVIDAALDPSHELLDVCRCWHLGRALEVLVVLPEILEPVPNRQRSPSYQQYYVVYRGFAYSSVAFISGHDWGEQNSVIAP